MKRVQPQVVPLSEFAHGTASAPGMIVLEADLTPVHGTALLDVTYATKSGRDLSLQLLFPPMPQDSTAVFPCVVYVQGSAWMEQNLGLAVPPLADFTRRGYVVAIVQYRPSSVAPFPAQIRDAKTAIRYLRRHAAEFHVDVTRMAMWGDSSGGHTTVMTGVTEYDQEFSDEPVTEALGIRCYVDYFGPTDISRMNEVPSIQDHAGPDSPEGRLIGGLDVLQNPDAAAPTRVVSHLSADRPVPPILIMHGSKDRLVPFDQSVLLYNAMRDAGQPVELYQLRGSDHGGPAFWQPAVLDLVDAFLQRHLR